MSKFTSNVLGPTNYYNSSSNNDHKTPIPTTRIEKKNRRKEAYVVVCLTDPTGVEIFKLGCQWKFSIFFIRKKCKCPAYHLDTVCPATKFIKPSHHKILDQKL